MYIPCQFCLATDILTSSRVSKSVTIGIMSSSRRKKREREKRKEKEIPFLDDVGWRPYGSVQECWALGALLTTKYIADISSETAPSALSSRLVFRVISKLGREHDEV